MTQSLNKIKFDEVYGLLSANKLTPYNFYNFDISADQYFAEKHYQTHTYDTIDNSQELSKCFLDIETFMNNEEGVTIPMMLQSGAYLINAVSHYYSKENKYYLYCILPPDCKLTAEQIRDYCLKESRKKFFIRHDDKKDIDVYDSYVDDNQDLEVVLFTDGVDLTIKLWDKIKDVDPAILSSFNGDSFDYPYMYQYLLTNLKDPQQVANIMSRFGELKVEKTHDRAGNEVNWIRFIEFELMDMLYLYKTRDDGGLGLGKKLSSYKLQNIASSELGITKYEYAAEGYPNLDTFYLKDPLNFFLYNLWDTALIVKLDNKMGMISLYNMQRRKMRTSLSAAMRGSSPLFDTFLYTELTNKNKYIRYGISSERTFCVSEKNINSYLKPQSNSKIKWTVTSIDNRTSSKILGRYPGAYVKLPVAGIYNDGFVCDFDATSLYPSVIKQYNIGINSFYGRVLSPFLDKYFNFFSRYCNTGILQNESFKEKLSIRCYQEAERFVENLKEDEYDMEEEERDNKFKNKNEAKQYYYYMMIYLFEKVLNSGFTIQELMNPENINQYIVSRVYLNNLLELLEICNPAEKEYNLLAYEYIINSNELTGKIKIIENYNEPSYRIIEIAGSDLTQYLKEKQIGITISGTLFKTHETELSIFYDFLNELYSLRKHYKKQMYNYVENSPEFNEFNRRQLTTKVIMNSTYGLLGMSSFRYSNKWLAKTITTSGRISLKTAQYFAEKYLDLNFS